MAKIKGMCHNYDGCDMAENKVVQEVDETNFICEECGKELYPIEETTMAGGINKKLVGIVAGAVVAVTALGAGAFALLGGSADQAESVSVLLDKHQATVQVEMQQADTLHATVTPADAELVWTSSNPDELSVDNGVVDIHSEGNVTVVVYAQIKDTDVKDSCVYELINQFDPEQMIEAIMLVENSVTVKVGETAHIACEPDPMYATEGILFESADEGIATVSESGEVKGVKPGKTTIRLACECGGVTAEVAVEVKGEPAQAPATSANGKSYAWGRYEGKLVNGKADGVGMLRYTARHRIVNTKEMYAEPGDYVQGTFANDEPVMVSWFGKDGVQKGVVKK